MPQIINDMQALYTIKSLYSKEEFMRFNRTLRFKNKKIVVFLSVLNVLLIVTTVLCLVHGDYFWAAVCGFYLVFLDWYLFRGIDKRTAKIFMQNKLIANQECEFRFYDDHFESITKNGSSNIDYDKIHRIIETKKNIYIMYSDNQGIMMPKPVPDGFVDFLHQVAQHAKPIL